ncbi:protein teflon isoform X2 [Drosophila sulfurigaster albostrigata]|uniref:protein teflon isoform X2 n=1 Tax=Drosophila sulfurigaster albostrigata TaxID=89887 RepID=UPI002D21A86B|nr:protein teflon isoform X2 [Drosophila sulfurigaster albostrigata]
MSLFANLLLETCVNFEKCGDVVVSRKENIVGLSCQFCCDIFISVIAFLHHLQKMHCDILEFPREHNVYTMNEIMSLEDDDVEVDSHVIINGETDEQINDLEIGLDANTLQINILKENNLVKGNQISGTELYSQGAELNKTLVTGYDKTLALKPRIEIKCERQLTLQKDGASEVAKESSTSITHKKIKRINNTKEELNAGITASTEIQDENNVNSFRLKKVNIVNIHKNAELAQEVYVPQKNIPKMNENNRKLLKEKKNTGQHDLETPVSRNKPILKKSLIITETNSLKTDSSFKLDHKTHRNLSSIIIDKIEYLPNIDLNFVKTSKGTTKETSKLEVKMQNALRESFSDRSNPAMWNNKIPRRPTYSEGLTSQISTKPEVKSSSKRSLVESIDEIKMSIIFDDNSKRKLPKNATSNRTLDVKQTDLSEELLGLEDIEVKSVETTHPKLRDDGVLLQFVGLNIIKDPYYEHRKPVEFCEVLRSKATKFSKILRDRDIIWNFQKSATVQTFQKIASELSMLTEQANKTLKADLNVSEVKRILNLISKWYTHQTTEKLFKKVELSSTTENYLLLFGFLPKLNRCVYYCEWCDECSANRSRYNEHRMSHLNNYYCPQCESGFLKYGQLKTHFEILHGNT